MERWRAGAQVVWAARRERPGDRAHVGFAAVYYWLMRHVAGLSTMPARGADCFLADRVVLDAFARLRERPVNVLALVTWLGFRQEAIEYDKHARQHGRSGWTLRKKIALVVDSMVAFSDLPIRLCAWAGLLCLVVAVVLLLGGLAQLPALAGGLLLAAAAPAGLAGNQHLALGAVRAKVWRALEDSRGRPPYVVERVMGVTAGRPVAVTPAGRDIA
jgi:dolichol-phosphate mannosyltransferase